MANEQYPDLQITQKQDGQYWDIVIPNLETSTTYGTQFAWEYMDGTISDFSDVFEFETPARLMEEVTDVDTEWVDADLKITWNKTSTEVKSYQIYLTAFGTNQTVSWTEDVDDSKVLQDFILTFEMNVGHFQRIFRKKFTGFIKSTYADGTTDGVAFTSDEYVDAICTGSVSAEDWSVTSVTDGFIVTWKDSLINLNTYSETNVYISTTNDPYNWELRYAGPGPAKIGGIDDFDPYYIKINHKSYSGCQSLDSDIKTAKALDLINFKDYPPDEVSNVSASWSGDDINITFTMPSTNAGRSVRVYLTSDGKERYITRDLTPPFSGQKTIQILAGNLNGLFGSYNPTLTLSYSGKNAKIASIDQYANESAGVAFDIPEKINPLATYKPEIHLDQVENGYRINLLNPNSDVDTFTVYASKSSPVSKTESNIVYRGILPTFILDIDYSPTYVVVEGYTKSSQKSLSSDEESVTPLSIAELSLIEFPIGLGTEGTIWSGPLQDNNNDGEPDKDTNGNLIPIQDGARAFFNRRGFFIYDEDNDLTTQIIGDGTLYNNPYAGTGGSINENKLTFITKSAQIANWRVSTDRIENTLSTKLPGDTTYTGMSGAGDYAFWAGANSSGNLNNNSKFWVKHNGQVEASDISIVGGNLRIGGETDLLAPFVVTANGDLKATNANIEGVVLAKEGQLGSVDVGTPPGHPDYGTPNQIEGQVRINLPVTVGQQTLYAKIEMGKINIPMTNTDMGLSSGVEEADAGIQITNSSNRYVQLDSLNGILARKGYVGGWQISTNTINKSNTVGMYAPANPQPSDTAFWAGASLENTIIPFEVTHGGSLIANSATIYGNVYAVNGGFGVKDPNKNPGDVGYIQKGWLIDSAKIKSTNKNAGDTYVELDGETGSIKGAYIFGSAFWLNSTGSVTNTDYISSDGTFRLGDGTILYDALGLTIGTNDNSTNVNFQNVDFYMGSKTGNISNYIKADGSFSFADGKLKGTKTGIQINGGEITFELTGTLESDDNGFAGDRMVGLNSSNKLTQTRRIIHNGQRSITNANISGWSNNSGYFTSGTLSNVSVKGGDLIMVGDPPLS